VLNVILRATVIVRAIILAPTLALACAGELYTDFFWKGRLAFFLKISIEREGRERGSKLTCASESESRPSHMQSETTVAYTIQGGEDAEDAISCSFLSAKEPLIIRLFCGK